MDEHFERMVGQMYDSCASYLAGKGEVPQARLVKAARAVVFARYHQGEGSWQILKKAIGRLEDVVGRPADPDDL